MSLTADEWKQKVLTTLRELSQEKLPDLDFSTDCHENAITYRICLNSGDYFTIKSQDLKLSTIYMDEFENLQVLQYLDDEIVDAIGQSMDMIAAVSSGVAVISEGKTRFLGRKFYFVDNNSKVKWIFKKM